MTRSLAHALAAATMAVAMLGCGAGSATAPETDNKTVSATADLEFTPSTVSVAMRIEQNPTATVTWKFQSVSHTVTWDDRPQTANVYDIGSTKNASVSRDFHVAGTYTYHCAIHPSMTGTVFVQ